MRRNIKIFFRALYLLWKIWRAPVKWEFVGPGFIRSYPTDVIGVARCPLEVIGEYWREEYFPLGWAADDIPLFGDSSWWRKALLLTTRLKEWKKP